jgi:hypothetical protein
MFHKLEVSKPLSHYHIQKSLSRTLSNSLFNTTNQKWGQQLMSLITVGLLKPKLPKNGSYSLMGLYGRNMVKDQVTPFSLPIVESKMLKKFRGVLTYVQIMKEHILGFSLLRTLTNSQLTPPNQK